MYCCGSFSIRRSALLGHLRSSPECTLKKTFTVYLTYWLKKLTEEQAKTMYLYSELTKAYKIIWVLAETQTQVGKSKRFIVGKGKDWVYLAWWLLAWEISDRLSKSGTSYEIGWDNWLLLVVPKLKAGNKISPDHLYQFLERLLFSFLDCYWR